MGNKVSKIIYMIMFNMTFLKGAQYRVLKKTMVNGDNYNYYLEVSATCISFSSMSLDPWDSSLSRNQNLLEEAEAQQFGPFPKSRRHQVWASGFLSGC